MPTHARQDGRDTSKPDARNLHRHAPGSNPRATEIRQTAEMPGYPSTLSGLEGRENANAGAAGGRVTPKPTPGTEIGQTDDERQRLREMALAWHAAGCVVHPAKSDGSKVPVLVPGGGTTITANVYPDTYASGPRFGQPHPRAGQPHPLAGKHGYGWKRLSTGDHTYPLELTLARLRHEFDGIGLFCGSVSGGLEMFELEGRAVHLLAELAAEADRRGIRELWDRFNAGCSETSPSGGIHWFLRRVGGPVPGNTKLALRPNPADPKKPHVFAETRGQGGWVVVAGSFGRTHASGKPYVLRSGSPATIPVFTVAEADDIHSLFRVLDEMPQHTTPTASVPTLERRERPAGELLPGDDFNQRARWDEVLTAPWAKLSKSDTADAWSKHGQGGRKTGDVYHETNTLFIYDTETAGQGRKLTLFSAYAWLHHDGDFRAAASALYGQGFGSRMTTRDVVPAATTLATTPAELPPVRVETFPDAPMVTVDELRASITGQIAGIVATHPALVVMTPGTSAGKTHAATRDIPAAFDRVIFNVDSHDNGAAIVERCKANGFDAGSIPPVDETTCAAWTDDDTRRIAAQHGKRPGLSMERAMAVGMSMLACNGCPLRPGDKTPAPASENELAFLEESGWDVSLQPATETSCRYWAKRREAESQPVVAQCQERTRRNPAAIAPHIGETVAVVTDENAVNVLSPRLLILVESVQAVGDVIRTAADSLAIRIATRRSRHAQRDHELATWARAVADVADDIAAEVVRLETTGDVGLHELNVAPVADERIFGRAAPKRKAKRKTVSADKAKEWFDAAQQNHDRHKMPLYAPPARAAAPTPEREPVTVPKMPHTALASLVARSDLPRAWTADAFEMVRLAAMGKPHGGRVYVSTLPNKTRAAHIHRITELRLPANVVHIVMDATAPTESIRRMWPDAVVLEPIGKTPFAKFAGQIWDDIRPDSHPARVVDYIERIVEFMGWTAAALYLCKSHRRVLFPQTRPRNGVPMDRPVDVAAIANWNRGKRHLEPADYPRRLREAEALARRLDAIRWRLAKDAHGNVRVGHMRGTVSRGSNAFMANTGVDGLAVIGFVRCNPAAIVGHLLATGQEDAVRDTDGQWTSRGIAGTLPTVTGGTRDVRWSGYADPAWADAAAAVNRADLTQTWSRARPQLAEDGVPVIAVAAEPCGLPLMDLPERPSAGVRAVVAAVERLAGCEDRQVSGGVEPVQNRPNGVEPERVNAVVAMGSIGHACIGHTVVPLSYTRVADRTCPTPGVAMDDIRAATGAPERSVRRWLADAVGLGLLARAGTGRWTRYGLPGFVADAVSKTPTNVGILPGAVADLEAATVAMLPTKTMADHNDPPLFSADVACPTTAANPKRAADLNDDATPWEKSAHSERISDDTTTAAKRQQIRTLNDETVVQGKHSSLQRKEEEIPSGSNGSGFEIAAAAVVVANADQSQHLNGANCDFGHNSNDTATTPANCQHVSNLKADDANAAFLEAAAELDDAWEPWVDDTVAAADAESNGQNVRLNRHQPATVWRVVSNERHTRRNPTDTPTHDTRTTTRSVSAEGGHARPPPGRVGVGNGG